MLGNHESLRACHLLCLDKYLSFIATHPWTKHRREARRQCPILTRDKMSELFRLRLVDVGGPSLIRLHSPQ